MPADEPGYARVDRWPYLRCEVKGFWAAVSRAERAGPVCGSLEQLAVDLESNKTSVRDHAKKLEGLGLMTVEIQPDGRWALSARIPEVAEIPSVDEEAARRGLIRRRRVRALGRPADPQRPLPYDEEPASLAVVYGGGEAEPAQEIEEEPVPDQCRNGNPFPIEAESRSSSGIEREPVPVPSAPPAAAPPGEPGGEPSRVPPRAALQLPKNHESFLPNPQNTKDTKYQSATMDSARARDPESQRRGNWDPPGIGEVLVDAVQLAIDRLTAPRKQVARLKQRILDLVPELRPSGVYLADWAARLVVIEYRLFPTEIDSLLGDVVAMRARATPEKPFDAGAFFNFKLKQLTAGHGIPWMPTASHRPPRNRSP